MCKIKAIAGILQYAKYNTIFSIYSLVEIQYIRQVYFLFVAICKPKSTSADMAVALLFLLFFLYSKSDVYV